MATKTISLDLEAHDRLKGARKPGESFSAAIKRLIPPVVDLDEWFPELDSAPRSQAAIDAVREAVDGRSSDFRSRP